MGDAAQKNRMILNLERPIKQGKVSNWENMEKILEHTLYKLTVTSNDQSPEIPIVLSETPLNPKETRKRMAEILFDSFNSSTICIANPAVLSSYASRVRTGVVVDSGYDITRIVPIYEGYALPHAVTHIELAGSSLTEYIASSSEQLLHSLNLRGSEKTRVARSIKEKCCDLSYDFENTMNTNTSSLPYLLPDGQEINISNERFRCPEVLFQPSLLHRRDKGIHEATYNSIMKCDEDLLNDLYTNIVLSGGNTMFLGLADRMQKEIIKF